MLGNLANVGHDLASALRAVGADARLIAPRDRLHAWARSSDHGDPDRDPVLEVVPAGPHWSPWCLRAARQADVVVSVCLAGAPLLPLVGRPYVSYANGSDLRELAMGAPIYPRSHVVAARRMFRSADLVLYSPDRGHVAAIEQLGLRRTAPWRQFVDLPFWSATPAPPVGSPLHVLCPSQLSWQPQYAGQPCLKRNDVLLHGFARFLGQGGAGHLTVLRRGPEAAALDRLLDRLDLVPNVTVVEHEVSKRQLRDLLASAQVVADQFGPEGCFGLIALEAMAAGRPVFGSLAPEVAARVYGQDLPPVLVAPTADDVAQHLHRLADPAERATVGDRGLAWVRRQHDRHALADWYLDQIVGVRSRRG